MEIKISVIMPVYNAAQYLKETLDSILKQTFKEYEIITVDDGSIDNSLEILKQYQAKFANMSILTQNNSGPSSARNRALRQAKGKYIYFFDADDLLVKDALEKLYYKAENENADLVIAKYDIFNEVRSYGIYNLDEIIKMKRIPWDHKGILWTFSCSNKLFRRDNIDNRKLEFPPVSYSEDGAFVMQYVYRSNIITGLNKVVFHYRRIQNSIHQSITSKVKIEKIKDYLEAHDIIYHAIVDKFLKEYSDYENINDIIDNENNVKVYLNEFYYKEVSVLVNQFYRLYWKIEEETLSFLVENIKSILSKLDEESLNKLKKQNSDLDLDNLFENYETAKKNALVAVWFYPNMNLNGRYQLALDTLCTQNLVLYRIYLPMCMKNEVEESYGNVPQISFVECESQEEFYHSLLNVCNEPFVMVADEKCRYDKDALLWMYKLLSKTGADVLETVAFQTQKGKAEYSIYRKILRRLEGCAKILFFKGKNRNFENKLIRLEFLKQLCDIAGKDSICTNKEIWEKAQISMTDKWLITVEKQV